MDRRFLGHHATVRHRYLAGCLIALLLLIGSALSPAGTILGSKHDFTGLNQRAGVVAMQGLAYSDYGSSCVYCHLPPEKENADSGKEGGIPGWNRYVPAV